jgi:PH (Pleckstrin Homology) domain-containing protein
MLGYVPGMTGKKREFTSLPYRKVQVSSIETAGTFDLDSELDLWFSGLGVRLEFKGQVDIRHLGQMIASYVLDGSREDSGSVRPCGWHVILLVDMAGSS